MSIRLSPLVPGQSTRRLRPWWRSRTFLLLAVLAAAGAGGCRLWRESRRSHGYDALIGEAARRHHVSPALVKGVIRQESRFQPHATGRAGEMGLMQITDGAVQDWQRVTGQRAPVRGMLFNPRLNIEIGTWYLAAALQRWAGHPDAEVLALAQYNAGARNAAKWASPDPTQPSLELVRFPATRQYIVRVLKFKAAYARERFDE